jgi:hypothetical protein
MSPSTQPSTATPEGREPKVDCPTWNSRGLFPHKTWPKYNEVVEKQRTTRCLVTPPDVTEQQLIEALSDLGQLLGDEHVELNDGPLVDSDYHYAPLSHDGYHM